MSDDRRALLESIAFGQDARTTPSDRMRALEQLQALGAFRSEAADDELTEEQVWSELDSWYSAMTASIFDVIDQEVNEEHFPQTARALRRIVGRMTELAVGADRLAREPKPEPVPEDNAIEGEVVEEPDPVDEPLPAAKRPPELPPGIDPAAGWPRRGGGGYAQCLGP